MWTLPLFPTPPFSNFAQLHSPSLLLPSPKPTALSVALFLQLNRWLRYNWFGILLNDTMDLYMLSLRKFVSEGPWCVSLLVLWFDITHTNTQTHTQTYSTLCGPVDWHTHINIYLHHLLCAKSSYLYYIECIIHWYQKFIFHNVFRFQACHQRKHHTCGCHMPKEHFTVMLCDSKLHAILWHVISLKLNIGKKITA